ncbi:MAG: hypothetical protein C4528_07525 [Gammaproteobacteria bacterium]|nr:MAG: hypothetical protein C4528_07525 [Gammaproteobacteria bacterium]
MTLACGCPESFPGWHEQDINLGGRLTHSVSIPAFLHMPISYELHRERQRLTLHRLGLKEQWPGLVLLRTGLLRGKILRLLEPAASPASGLNYLPQPFWVRGLLHQGPISAMAQGVRRVQSALIQTGKKPLELYVSHLTCPHCAEQRGGEKILLLRRWTESPALLKRVNKRG